MRESFATRTTFTTVNARIKVKRQKFADGTEKTTLQGYPIVWNTLSSDRGGYKVRLAPNSAIFSTPTMALWHHQFDKPIGGTVNETLRILAADDIGVPVEIDLDLDTTAGSDALAYVSSGLV
jgi:phage head maturation protease